MQKKSLHELSADELNAWMKAHNQPTFRTKQIMDWLNNKLVISYEEMVNIPKSLREELAVDFTPIGIQPVDILRADDGTVKWASQLSDGAKVETVLIRAPERTTVCISTQVGCAVRCVFCESGRHGFVRNLKSSEIIEQVILASHEAGALVDNVVVMGTGEPMHNLDNLIPALNTLCDPENGFGMGARHITISTSGVPAGIRRLASHQKPWNLALSLHAPNDALRAQIIPDHHRSDLADILDACQTYRDATGRMLTFEYVLVDGLNDGDKEAFSLARLAKLARAKVNLIPCNQGSAKLNSPSIDRCKEFLKILTARGVQATIRLRKGDKIKAACGQLVAKKQNSPEA